MEHFLSRTSTEKKNSNAFSSKKKKIEKRGKKLWNEKMFQIRSPMQVPSARNECSQNRNNFDIDFYYKFRILSVDPFLVALAFFFYCTAKKLSLNYRLLSFIAVFTSRCDEVKIFILYTRRD